MGYWVLGRNGFATLLSSFRRQGEAEKALPVHLRLADLHPDRSPLNAHRDFTSLYALPDTSFNLLWENSNPRWLFHERFTTKSMQTYYYLVASQKFLTEDEPLDEVLRERRRHYQEQERELDFWLVKQPAFLESDGFGDVKSRCPQPAAAVISTDKTLITWLKLRLEYVITGEFKAPTEMLPDPIASLEPVY